MSDDTVAAVDLRPPDQVLQAASRRRAWLLAGAAALLVLIYLVSWSAYSTIHVRDRYRQLTPGASGSVRDGQTRLLSITRTDRLLDTDDDPPQIAEAGATFVVAELELTQQRPVDYVYCDAVLLGPGGRTWDPAGTEVERATPSCSTDDVVVGRPYRYEEVYLVPLADADQLVGLAMTENSTSARVQVLRPPT